MIIRSKSVLLHWDMVNVEHAVIKTIGHITGLGGLEVVAEELITLLDDDRQSVETAIRHARPAPADTDVTPHHGASGAGHVHQGPGVQPGRVLCTTNIITCN